METKLNARHDLLETLFCLRLFAITHSIATPTSRRLHKSPTKRSKPIPNSSQNFELSNSKFTYEAINERETAFAHQLGNI
jgi:hypothetical protein